jgi:SAM-dependent methyltransferase
MEALLLLRDLGAAHARGGPLSERGGVFWLTLPSDALDRARLRFARLGYSYAVDQVEPAPDPSAREVVRWRGRPYGLLRLHEKDPGELREAAPDRREFALETGGRVRLVRGYRGDSGPLSRRGLPVIDARMLVNLVSPPEGATLLDPFAGAGGVVLAALAGGYRALSCDIDPALRHGVRGLGAQHAVADARRVPFADGSIDAIATEPPYEQDATDAVVGALQEMARVLHPGGRVALLCAAGQADALRAQATALGLAPFHAAPIDRKGTPCAVLAWEKT